MSTVAQLPVIRSKDAYTLVQDNAERTPEQEVSFDNAMALPTWDRAKGLYEDHACEVLACLAENGIPSPTATELLRFIGAFAWELYEAELDTVKIEADEETRRLVDEHYAATRTLR